MILLESACNYYNSDYTTFNQEYKDFLKKYFLAQIDGFEYGKTGAGWYVLLELIWQIPNPGLSMYPWWLQILFPYFGIFNRKHDAVQCDYVRVSAAIKRTCWNIQQVQKQAEIAIYFSR